MRHANHAKREKTHDGGTVGIELPYQEKIRTLGEKETTNTWEYWKRTTPNKQR